MRLLTPDESGADGRGPQEREAAASARLAAAFSATAGPGSDLIDLARRLAKGGRRCGLCWLGSTAGGRLWEALQLSTAPGLQCSPHG